MMCMLSRAFLAAALLLAPTLSAQALQACKDGQCVSNPGGIHKCKVIGQQCRRGGGGAAGPRCWPIYSCN